MDHADHVQLLRDGVTHEQGTWADLGAGTGAFTLALADLVGDGSSIYAIDRDAGALDELARRFRRQAASRRVRVEPRVADFQQDLALGPLDGVVMANSLHFVKDKTPVIARVRAMLRPGGTFLLVEYDTDHGNTWVPYPISFASWGALAPDLGFSEPRLLGSVPSRFLRRIYAAGCEAPPGS